jgi:hypothetical protein
LAETSSDIGRMRILIRTSKWAIWARRLGSFAIPMLVIPLVLHRGRLIESPTFVAIEMVTLAIAAMGLLAALIAYGRLWVTGDQGWLKATWGLGFSLLCLAPFGYLGAMAVRYPRVSEVSTNSANPVPLSTTRSVAPMDEATLARIASRFPNATTRSYPLDTVALFDMVQDLVAERGWDIRTRRAPQDGGETGALTAMAMTPFGFVDEVAIRVAPAPTGANVDMRSVPTFAFHDFGSDGERVEDFLLALDRAVTLALRNVPQGTPSDTGDTDATAPAQD